MKRLLTRAGLLTVGLSLFFVAGTGAAWGFWTASNTGNGGTTADAFPSGKPAKPIPSVAGTTVKLQFDAVVTTGSRSATAYVIKRYDSAGANPQVFANPSCSTASTVTCTLTGVPLGTWKYSYQPQL